MVGNTCAGSRGRRREALLAVGINRDYGRSTPLLLDRNANTTPGASGGITRAAGAIHLVRISTMVRVHVHRRVLLPLPTHQRHPAHIRCSRHRTRLAFRVRRTRRLRRQSRRQVPVPARGVAGSLRGLVAIIILSTPLVKELLYLLPAALAVLAGARFIRKHWGKLQGTQPWRWLQVAVVGAVVGGAALPLDKWECIFLGSELSLIFWFFLGSNIAILATHQFAWWPRTRGSTSPTT